MSHHHRRAAAISAPDPFFQDTVLLLTGNGTNGGQNNTFLDDSSNNFGITRNGNTTQGSFSPFGWQWSNYFDGTGDFLTVADNANIRPGTSSFTLEAWVNRNASGAAHTIFSKGSSTGPTGFVFQITSTNVLRFTDTSTNIDSTGTILAGVWTHIAVVREGTGTNQTKLYINGNQDGQGTSATDFTQTDQVKIGRDRGTTAEFNGYISNLRFLKGTAQYTANFTPSITPLTAVTNTQLLTCQSSRFVDNSANAFAITRNGDVAVSNFSPFPAGEYATAVEGGSGYFDGNGDNLTAADNAAFEFGSGSFSVDCWVYISSLKGYQAFVSKPGATDGNGWNLFIESNNTFRFIAGTGGSWTINIGPTVAVPAQWYHVCITRDTSNQWRLFLNGKLDATTNNSFSQPDLAYPLYVGKYPNFPSYSSAKDFGGYMSSLRIVKGGMPSLFDTSTTTVGTQVFTPPTAPYTGSESLTAGSVSLLLNFTNGSIVDATGKNDLETVGNAQISTSVKKYGTGSLKFDGTGDYLSAPSSSNFNLGSSDFTIECWLNSSSFSSAFGVVSRYDAPGGSARGWALRIVNSTTIRFIRGADIVWDVTVSTLSTSTWYHISVARSGSSLRMFVDGTQVGTTQTISTFTDAQSSLQIGRTNTITDDLNGYIDDLRISKVARYTANFTAPTRQLPAR